MDWGKIEEKIASLLQKEDRKDAEFRYLLLLSQVGDIAKYLTHDPELNPDARPYGNKEDEILIFGQAFVQLIALVQLRGVLLDDAIHKGVENWEDADWRSRKGKGGEEIVGQSACRGYVIGRAYVVSDKHPLEQFRDGMILVTPFARPDIVFYASAALAYVTDHGGVTCHAANIARERNIPCLVGTGDATSLIPHNQKIIVDTLDSQRGVALIQGD